jgi:hypothetical protein
MTKRTDKYGRPWHPAPPRQPIKPGSIVSRARSIRWAAAKPELPGATAKSRIYWAAYRAGQIAKREAGMEYQPPDWLGARKRSRKKREWLPGEHKKPKPSTTLKEQKPKPDQDQLF